MATDLHCAEPRRRALVRADSRLNGLDYVEVSDDRRRLTVFLLDRAPEGLTEVNFRITGGRRMTGIRVVRVEICRSPDDDRDDCVRIWLDRAGDLSCYRLCVVAVDAAGGARPHPVFDPRYACLDFTFAAGCPSDVDCLPQPCPPEVLAQPAMTYLAKDYGSFRRLIFDRLSLLVPGWRERHVPDLGVALVELLAYVADHLSYYQDAVATEAYLETARRRTSVRRHARLVDYAMHEGCNARAWVHVRLHDRDVLEVDLARAAFITDVSGAAAVAAGLVQADDLARVPTDAYEWFEPVQAGTATFRAAHNEIHLYAWGDFGCCLQQGATGATLVDSAEPAGRLSLAAGDVLIFEEVLGPKTGKPADADASHRHAVRLTSVLPSADPLTDQAIVEVEWAAADALPFALCISAVGPAPECRPLEAVSVARGNIVLVDHGRRVREVLGTVPAGDVRETCGGACREQAVHVGGRLRPTLTRGPLTFRQPLDAAGPATLACGQDPRRAAPELTVFTSPADADVWGGQTWAAEADLIANDGDDRAFVVEVNDDGLAELRFGDGERGRALTAGDTVAASYRVGNGAAGNVGAETIAHLVMCDRSSGVRLDVRNPMPAAGGLGSEMLNDVRLRAPNAFRQELRRAVTAGDYAQIALREFAQELHRAAGELRWTGSWYEARVAVDTRAAIAADAALLDRVGRTLSRYRRVGHDVRVRPAVQVALSIELLVCVQPHYIAEHVKAALLERFSNRILPDGSRGLFHPDDLTFGEGVFVSRLVAAAVSVPGVENVVVTRLQRLDRPDDAALESGVLSLKPYEVARVDTDPVYPEHGAVIIRLGGRR